jgi:S-adenosylmethionine:tRNA-ribosyltransferase-isomerase (queuine synthetase)
MGCVSDQYSGVASGVNNAVTRTSGVFANAIFGALAVLLFGSALQKDLAKTSFEEESKKEIAAQVVNLGNAKAPSHLPDADRQKIQELYQQGFLDAYKTIMILAAALCFGATLMAVLFVEKGVPEREREDKLSRS